MNFTAAARRLHMAASPLSQRIRDQERELDNRLFERDPRRHAHPREALLPLARDVLEQVNSIPCGLREATRPERSSMFVGVHTGVHRRPRELINTLAERVSVELLRWPGTSKSSSTALARFSEHLT
ncbi:LysR family transcriptional regulator [Streptomyces sp. NPDC050564]|uniref:LysR family transcriptional regulator n=1 Tax=Streptomyces sp. NPDC050564 TaxID=3365631 RepID=UPI003798AB89